MADYTQGTNFAAKDSLLTGNPSKLVRGTEINEEFNRISIAILSKANINSPNLTGTPTAVTQPAGTNTTALATTQFVTTNFPTTNITFTGDNTHTGMETFRDNKFVVTDNTDTTKKVALEVSGVTTGTTRTLTVPNKDGTIAVTSDLAAVSALDTVNSTIVTGTYSVSGSTTATITATHAFAVGQEVFITFSNTSGDPISAAKFTIATVTGTTAFTVTLGSSITSGGNVTVERYGLMALANSVEALDRTKNLKALSPSTLRDAINAQNAPPIYACRAWVTFDATRNAAGTSSTGDTNRFIYASGNVTSVLKTADGRFTITLTTAMPNANYAVTGQAKGGTGNSATMVNEAGARTTTTIDIAVTRRDSGNDAAPDNSDFVSIAIFG